MAPGCENSSEVCIEFCWKGVTRDPLTMCAWEEGGRKAAAAGLLLSLSEGHDTAAHHKSQAGIFFF